MEASAFTGSESTEIRWGAFDTKSKEISPKAKENERKYNIFFDYNSVLLLMFM